jgi:fructose-bisphosphate aldolase/6-deoxy-5-ketofructose 1-phosphate synthase
MHNNHDCFIPADVPEKKHTQFANNYAAMTRNTGRLFLFSCDHRIEHLSHDFYGPNINPQALHPEHLFRIASQGSIGAMATHLGLIARYAHKYTTVNYVAKLNGSTNLVQQEQRDPRSALLWSVDDVLALKNSTNIAITGVGITLYLGSNYEPEQLAQAAQVITHAHREGLVTIIWMYPRGKAIHDEHDPHLLIGTAGVALSLGADFVKIKMPATTNLLAQTESLKIMSAMTGNSKIICSGGSMTDSTTYLTQLYETIHHGSIAGTATGRNIFQRSLTEGVALTRAISAIVYDNVDLATSLSLISS